MAVISHSCPWSSPILDFKLPIFRLRISSTFSNILRCIPVLSKSLPIKSELNLLSKSRINLCTKSMSFLELGGGQRMDLGQTKLHILRSAKHMRNVWFYEGNCQRINVLYLHECLTQHYSNMFAFPVDILKNILMYI